MMIGAVAVAAVWPALIARAKDVEPILVMPLLTAHQGSPEAMPKRSEDNVSLVAVGRSDNTNAALPIDGEPKGSLVIIGGSERFRDSELWETIVALAGGQGARIAVFPTAVGQQPIQSCATLVQTLQRAGAQPFIVPVAWSGLDRDVREAVFDPELVKQVRESDGVYFVGGSQGRIVDALRDENGGITPMLQAIWDVYRRGGVVAGTSAGAAIMSQVMYRDPPTPLAVLRNGVRMGEELDNGLGFLDAHWFVEQHCLVRGRFARALAAMQTEGIPFGIGIDENTALIIQRGYDAQVIGYKGVLVMDLTEATHDPSIGDFNLSGVKVSYLDRGDRINLRTREVTPASEKLEEPELNPHNVGFDPHFDHEMFYADILGNCTVADLLGRLIDNRQKVAIGLALDGKQVRQQSSRGYEFRFSHRPDSRGWYTEEFGGEDYTVLNIQLDIRPIEVMGPLYEQRPNAP